MFFRSIFPSRELFAPISWLRGLRQTLRHRHTGHNITVTVPARFLHLNNTDNSFDEEAVRIKFKSLGKNGSVVLKKLANRNEGTAVISISNPEKKNAMTGVMMAQLAEVVDELETWNDGKAVIVHGTHGTFCSGADLSVAKAIQTPEEGGEMSALMQRTLMRLRRLPIISVAAIEGRALGGGAEILLACDYRLMSKSAEIRFVQAKLGVTPGWGGGAKLVRLVGRQQALELLLQAKKVSLTDALKCGLVDGRLEDGMDAIDSTCNWLSDYLEADTAVLRAMKAVVSAGDDNMPDNALEIERSIFTTVWGADANKEALNQQKKHR